MSAIPVENSSANPLPRQLLRFARLGSVAALGQLLESFRPYMLHMASQEFPSDLEAKAGASDLVQQSFLEAHEDFAQFQGKTEAEFLAWLRRILSNNRNNLIRGFRETQKRDIQRERNRHTSDNDWTMPVDSSDPPSEKLIRREELHWLRQALGKLPEEYRLVIQWHQHEHLTFQEIGQRLNRSAEAARKLWARGIERLRQQFEAPP